MTERAMQATLAVSGAWLVVTGLLALVAPDTFFDQIGHYGRENSHYVGDVGAFQLAAGLGLWMAVRYRSFRIPMLVVGAFWFGLHALNHAFDTAEARSEARGWLDTILLAFGAVGSGWLASQEAKLEAGDRKR